jgi:hypothetical protein
MDWLYRHYPELLAMTLALMVVAGGVYLDLYKRKVRKAFRKFKTSLRGKIMTREERVQHNKTIQGDAIYEALMKLVEDNKQTRYDVRHTLRRLANVLNMPDFVPVKNLSMENLTTEEFELIQGILRSKAELNKLLFAKKKTPIPGPKPGEVDNVMVFPTDTKYQPGKKKFGGNLLKKAAIV